MKKGPKELTRAFTQKEYPDHHLKEVAFVGRSNVGKSSLINSLFKRKGFAAISSSPGKTRSINFYSFSKEVVFVDLPGYGYAKVSQAMKESWSSMIEEYLYTRENLTSLIHLVDARHRPSKDDITMREWLRGMDFPVLVAATKADKISRGRRKKQERLIRETLAMDREDALLFFSAVTGEGRGEVLAYISSTLKED